MVLPGTILVGVALLGAALLGTVSCAKHEGAESHIPAQAVRTGVVASSIEPARIAAVGTLRSDQEAVLASKVMGTVLEVRARAGDRVRKGQVLIVVDSRDVAGQIAQAKGALAQAQAAASLTATNFQRFQQLHEKGAASQLELDQARFQYDTAKGAVAQAEGAVSVASSYRSYAEIPAPFDGQVIDRMIEVGDMAAPGRPLMRIEDPGRIRLDAALSESEFPVAKLEEPVLVQVPSLGEAVLGGTVREVVPALDPSTRSTLVKITLPQDPRLRSGLYARVWFQGAPTTVVRVPREALLQRGGLTGVMVVEDGRARYRLITTSSDPATELPASAGTETGGASGSGAAPAAMVEVLAGLRGGEEIVLAPPSTLQEGTPLEVRHD